MIFALGRTKPNSNNVAANLVQHAVNGVFTLDLTRDVPDLPGQSSSGSGTQTGTQTSATLAVPTQTSGSSGSGSPFNLPYTSREKKLIAHGIISALGFCFFLPIGVLQARFLRIWWPKWFKTHWFVQAGMAGPFIVTGFALAVSVISDSKSSHFDDKHQVSSIFRTLTHADHLIQYIDYWTRVIFALYLPVTLRIDNPFTQGSLPSSSSHPKLWSCYSWFGVDRAGILSSLLRFQH